MTKYNYESSISWYSGEDVPYKIIIFHFIFAPVVSVFVYIFICLVSFVGCLSPHEGTVAKENVSR